MPRESAPGPAPRCDAAHRAGRLGESHIYRAGRLGESHIYRAGRLGESHIYGRIVGFVDAREWDERYDEKPILWGAEPNRLFAEIVSELEPGRALDLAAGEGRNSIWLASQGWDVTAVDFSGVALERGRAMAAESGVEVDFVLADVLAYEPAAETFDLVAIVYLHLQAPDRRVVLARSERALRPGGSLVIIGHDLRNLEDGVGGPQDPAVLLSPDALVEELPGCEIRRAETVRRDVPDHGGIALDTVVVAKRPG